MSTMAVVTGSNTLQMWALGLLSSVAGLAAIAYLQPRWFMSFVVRNSHPSVLWCALTSSRVCALTIDDAPSPATPQLLDILAKHNVKATFFIISGNIPGNEEVLRRIVREGHVLGNHLTEDRASILDSLHVFEQKLQECDAALHCFNAEAQASDGKDKDAGTNGGGGGIDDDDDAVDAATKQLLGSVPSSSSPLLGDIPVPSPTATSSSTLGRRSMKWMRPASGWFTSSVREIAQRHGYRICMGSVYPHDAQIKSEVINACYLRNRTQCGSVIIVHDRQWTVGVLQNALPELVRKFKFVSLEELTLHHRCT
ncbi:TPA: hypothetical protein N0F65_003900 [Lagenidium giganteum]|uniref:NodB homology domain-containing protein n=1 Tax=Lagenidium giganteum TaxID=4803 RepID=A0AAV2ZB80_9STRA|nr:TPA: hypothetical protein N0F65_003900 [Lagenidium giganteum]